MDLPLNQPSWEQDQIHEGSSIYSSGPGLPYVSHLGVETASGVASCFRAPCLNPAISDTHSWNHLQLGHPSCYNVTAPMLAATSRLGALYGGPNLIGQLDPSRGARGKMGDLQTVVPVTQLPAPPAPASSPPEQKSRTRKRNLGRDKNSHTSDTLQPNKIFQCKWEGCTYMGYFSRDHELMRHIQTKHVNPGAYRCPVNGCDKVSNRQDNLKQHMMTRHQLF